MVERNLAKVEVAGSIPVIRSKNEVVPQGAPSLFSPHYIDGTAVLQPYRGSVR